MTQYAIIPLDDIINDFSFEENTFKFFKKGVKSVFEKILDLKYQSLHVNEDLIFDDLLFEYNNFLSILSQEELVYEGVHLIHQAWHLILLLCDIMEEALKTFFKHDNIKCKIVDWVGNDPIVLYDQVGVG